mmetsp:Transcript_24637/g.73145  ORF Transcript_24637/g.73145 Transcript_24637/m.73145 type:complete len:227 (+) Transcript_24637:2394-3074(+)
MRIEEFQLVSLKMISEALLLKTPTYAAYTSLPLTVPGELQGRNLGFARQVVLWASNANKGARAMANELATAFTGVIVCGGAEIPPRATHMLLYLCEATWSDDRLAEQVERVREAGLPIVMAHENDPDRDGCAFARFFETTPQELVASGIYRDLAIACFPGLHRQVSLSLLAKVLGASPSRARRGGMRELRRNVSESLRGRKLSSQMAEPSASSSAPIGPAGQERRA